MKELIRKILKEEKLSKQDVLKNQVLKYGWISVSRMIGFDNLYKIGFNNDPMEFLSLFNNLEIIRNKQKPNWLVYRFNGGENLMGYNNGNNVFYVNWDYIWSFFSNGLELTEVEIKNIIDKWLSDSYDIDPQRIMYLWTI